MRKNYVQAGVRSEDQRIYLENDWYSHGIPPNVEMEEDVYVDTSYGFSAFHSKKEPGLYIGKASGCYDRSSFIVGEEGQVTVGRFTVLNGTVIVCKNKITIGNHCLIAWSTVITDTWLTGNVSLADRRSALSKAADDPLRKFPFCGETVPVTIEDNCWVGFGSIILPGVTLGRACIVGSKTVINKDVPPYAVVVGDPPRIIKYLEPNDTEECKKKAINTYLRPL